MSEVCGWSMSKLWQGKGLQPSPSQKYCKMGIIPLTNVCYKRVANISELRAPKHTKKQVLSDLISQHLLNRLELKSYCKAAYIQAFKDYSYKTIDN